MNFPYEKPVNAAQVNIASTPLLNIATRFEALHALGVIPGGQLVIRRHGQVVLNHVIGVARGWRRQEFTDPVRVSAQTAFPAYSIGKPLAAIAIALLEERGLIDINTAIADFIPEFGLHNKSDITVLDVLTHTAGLVVPSISQQYKCCDHEVALAQLIDSKPLHKRGTFAYLPTEYGLILCAVVRRITGKPLSTWFFDEIAQPLQLPELRYGLAGRELADLAHSYWLGNQTMMIAGTNMAEHFEETNNSAPLFNTLNPAISLVTDAAHLAAFFEFIVNRGISHNGQTLLSETTLQKYTQVAASGWNKSLNQYVAFSRGFQVGTRFFPSLFGWWGTQGCFGHGGALSSLAFGDYRTKLAVALITNGNQSIRGLIKHIIPLAHRIRQVCRD